MVIRTADGRALGAGARATWMPAMCGEGFKEFELGGSGTGGFFGTGDLQRGIPIVMKYLFYRKNDTTRQEYFGTCRFLNEASRTHPRRSRAPLAGTKRAERIGVLAWLCVSRGGGRDRGAPPPPSGGRWRLRLLPDRCQFARHDRHAACVAVGVGPGPSIP